MGVGDESALTYYQRNYSLITDYGFTLTELEAMLPFERDVYLRLVKEELDRRKTANARR